MKRETKKEILYASCLSLPPRSCLKIDTQPYYVITYTVMKYTDKSLFQIQQSNNVNAFFV